MSTTRPAGRAAWCAVAAASVLLSGCSSGTDPSGPRPSTARSGHAASSPSSTAAAPATGRPHHTAAALRLPIGLGWGPTRREIDRARALVVGLTLRERAGQVIVARYPGTAAPVDLVTRLHLGGVIVDSANFSSTDQIRRSNQELQRAATAAGRRWPVLVGVDQEGGVVARVTGSATGFPAFMAAGAARDRRLTTRAAAASGAELAHLGFNVDFAPEGDVTAGPGDPTIGSRSAGSDPRLVTRQMRAAAAGYRSAGVLPVVKHFPGHGSVTVDSHQTLPVQPKTLRQLTRRDLQPFESAVDHGLPAVMVGHLDVRAVDPGTPSSLSRRVVTGLLRTRLGFHGLAVTDALNMAAVTDRFDSAQSAVRALAAGEDVLLMPPRPRLARDGIVRAVRQGRLSEARLDQAATRLVAVLLHQRAHRTAGRAPGSGAAASRALSARSITVVSGPCRGPLVGSSVRVEGPETAVARFTASATSAGLRVGAGPKVVLVGYRGRPGRGAVVVSLDTPYVLGQSRAGVAKIAVYGDTAGAMSALVDVLLGRAHAPGRLPVPVPGVDRTGCP